MEIPQEEPEDVTKVVTVPQFAKQTGLSMKTAYSVVKKMPEHIKVQLGTRVRLLAGPLDEWLKAGGTRAADGVAE